VIRYNKASVRRAPPPYATQSHPARGEGGGNRPEFLEPRPRHGAGRGDDQRTGVVFDLDVTGGKGGVGQGDPLVAQDGVCVLNRTVGEDRANIRVNRRHQALRLAKRIGAKHRRDTVCRVFGPPIIDLPGQNVLRCPGENRQAKGAFGDKGVAFHRLEWL